MIFAYLEGNHFRLVLNQTWINLEYRDFSSLKSPKFEKFISVECVKLLDYDVHTDSLAGSMVNLFSDGLKKFAPSVTHKSRLKERGQFIYNKEIAEAKQLRRQLERNCNKRRREIDRQLLKAQRYRIRSMAKKHKTHKISFKLAKSNPCQLFEQNKSLSAPVVRYLPSGFDNDESLANGFAEYFYDKVDKITADFDDSNNVDMDDPSFNGVRFDEFLPLASNETNKLRQIKCSQLDIIPQLYGHICWK